MDIIDYKARAKTRYTDLFNTAVFDAIVQTLMEHKQNRQVEYKQIADLMFDIDAVTGRNLDQIGKLIGQSRELVDFIDRPYFGFEGARFAEAFDVGEWYSIYKHSLGGLRVLSDSEYRRLIKARIIKNHTNCSRNDFLKILNLLSGNELSTVEVLAHGVIKITVVDDDSGMASYFLSKWREQQSLMPVPLGYRISVQYKKTSKRTFESELYPNFLPPTGTRLMTDPFP